jgi:hypothetical protein
MGVHMSNPTEVTTPAERLEVEPVTAASESPTRSGSRLIWMLVALALVPAGIISQLPGGWERLPAVAQWSFIALSAVVTLAVVWLILRNDADHTS